MTRPNGLVTELDYSPAERLTAMATTTDLGALVQENQLVRDGDGRITSLIDPFGSHDYSYDAKGRLTAADHPPTSGLTDEAYTYDSLGNRTSWTDHAASEVVYDAEGRLVQDAEQTSTWDEEGRLVSTTDRVTGETTTYTWNGFDELVAVTHPDGTETTYAYDGLGRRIEVVHEGVTTHFGYDAGDLRLVFDETHTLVSWRTTDPWGDLLAEHDPLAGTSRDALLGYLGTLEGWADDQGVEYIERDSFGNPAVPVPSTRPEPHALTWHAQDPNGLIYAGARYLDPGTGRFISQDPVAAGNLYSYALNDPIHAWDPFGAVAAIEDSSLRSKTGTASAGGAREIGIRLACIFNEAAAIVAQTGVEAVVVEVIGVGCSAVGKKKPGRPPRACSLCLTEDAELAVPEGSRSIEEMEVGDRVLSDEPEAEGGWVRVEDGPEASAPAEGTWVYEAHTGRWLPLQGAPPPGLPVLRGGELDGRSVPLSALERADATWEESPRHGVPTLSSWVLVLGEDLHHAPLSDVEVGRQVAFEGRVFDTLGLEQVSAVRPTGQVVARVVDTFARLAPEVLEATISHEDGTTELLTGTPEHPVHLAAEGRYAPLRELRPGDRLTTRDGTEAVLQQVERRYGDIEVYNVEVAGQHNYLADDLLVHNAKRKCEWKSPTEWAQCDYRQILREVSSGRRGTSHNKSGTGGKINNEVASRLFDLANQAEREGLGNATDVLPGYVDELRRLATRCRARARADNHR